MNSGKRRNKIFEICEEIFALETNSKYLSNYKYVITIRNREDDMAYYELKVGCNLLKVYKTQHLVDGKGINSFATAAYVLTGQMDMPEYKTEKTLLLSGSTNDMESFFVELSKLAPELDIKPELLKNLLSK